MENKSEEWALYVEHVSPQSSLHLAVGNPLEGGPASTLLTASTKDSVRTSDHSVTKASAVLLAAALSLIFQVAGFCFLNNFMRPF